MKNLFFIGLLILGIINEVYSQDTIIENPDYFLQIQRVTEKTSPYEFIRTGEHYEVFEYEWRNSGIQNILEDWMTFMQLEEIEFRIEENIATRKDLLEIVAIDSLMKNVSESDSINLRNLYKDTDVVSVFMGYNVIYKQKRPFQNQDKKITRQAFEDFCSVLNLEVIEVKESVTYWKLEIVDMANAAISFDQNTHWKRTDLEEYIYYERIKYRRIADLLSRKLDTFVKPIPYNAQKFDIRMPYSDDVFDLKYAMIEHGLELTEVNETIDILVVRPMSEVNE